MSDSTTPSGRAHFIRYAPKRPRAADQYSKGVRAMSKREALECAHMQIQPSEMRATIMIDLDREESYSIVREMDYPLPNLMMVNPANGHLHGGWQLADPVTFGLYGRSKPREAFIALQRQITLLYGADTAFGAYLAKTPGHPRWETIETGQPLYQMAALFEAMPQGITAQVNRRARTVHGEGRHDTLWQIGRRWCYAHAKAAKKRGNYDGWQAQVCVEFMTLNSFAQPLGTNQVRSLARNVAAYCWRNAEKLNGSVLDDEKRSLIPSWHREPISEQLGRKRMAQGQAYTSAQRRNVREDKIMSAIAQLAGQGVQKPTAAQIATLAGVHPETVRRFRRAAGVQQGMGN